MAQAERGARERWAGAAGTEEMLAGWRRGVRDLLPLGGASSGNAATLYFDGDQAFDAMWEAIDGAKESLKLETYILAPDVVGFTTLEKLADAAERGVDVTLIYDHWGARSYSFRDAFRSQKLPTHRLRKAGARVMCFNPWGEFFNPLYVAYSWLKTRSVFHRTHRKLLIVDGRVGFTGGRNVGADYAGPKIIERLRRRRARKRLEREQRAAAAAGEPAPAADAAAAAAAGYTYDKPFRDTHMRLVGPVVQDLEAVFRDSLREAEASKQRGIAQALSGVADAVRHAKGMLLGGGFGGGSESLPPLQLPAEGDDDAAVRVGGPDAPGGAACQVGFSNRYTGVRSSQALVLRALRHSTNYCLITAAYFVPTDALRRAIMDACRRGVRVHLITAGPSDSLPVKWGSLHVMADYIRAGVRVYEYRRQVLHAKSLTCDGVYSVVGTSNMEHWSLNRNLETDVAILDAGVASELESQFNRDLEHCRALRLGDVTSRSPPQRALHYAAYLGCVLFPARDYGSALR